MWDEITWRRRERETSIHQKVLRTGFFLLIFQLKLRLIQHLLAWNTSCFSLHWQSSPNAGEPPWEFHAEGTSEVHKASGSHYHTWMLMSSSHRLVKGQACCLCISRCARRCFYYPPCYGLNCVSSKAFGDKAFKRVIRAKWSHKAGTWSNRTDVLIRRGRDARTLCFMCIWRQDHVRTQPGRESSTESSPDCTLVLNFQIPDPWENSTLFKPPSLWYFVMAA